MPPTAVVAALQVGRRRLVQVAGAWGCRPGWLVCARLACTAPPPCSVNNLVDTPRPHAWLCYDLLQEAADAAGEDGEARQRWRRRLHHYLDWIFQKDSQLGADFAELQVGCAVAVLGGRQAVAGRQAGWLAGWLAGCKAGRLAVLACVQWSSLRLRDCLPDLSFLCRLSCMPSLSRRACCTSLWYPPATRWSEPTRWGCIVLAGVSASSCAAAAEGAGLLLLPWGTPCPSRHCTHAC